MKKIKLQSMLFILFIAAALTSCSSDSDENQQGPNAIFKRAFVTDVIGPTTGETNQELSYNVVFTVENGCGEFNQFTDIDIDKLEGYQVEAKYPTTDCVRVDPEIRNTTYKVKSPIPGTFYLRFAKSETEFITKTVVID